MPYRLTRRTITSSAIAMSIAAATPRSVSPARAQSATPADPPRSHVRGALEELPSIIQTYIEETGVPGIAAAVVYQDEVVFAEGFGTRDIGTDEPVDADTVFQLASVSKPISSTVIASLVDEGLITWDTRMAEIDPGFALSDPLVTSSVTIADLFSHRSGLPDHVGDPLEDLGADREEVLYRLRFAPLAYPFRAGYSYTNFGLTAAADAAARFAGTTFEDLADERLFGPLGMGSSSFRHSDYSSRENRALLHVLREGEWVQAFDRQPDAQAPAGGASGSVTDLAQWMRLQLLGGMLDGERRIDANALGMTHLAHSISTMPDPPYSTMPGFYGLGWNVGYDASGNVVISHSGAFALGAGTSVYLRPADGLGIVVLTNGKPMGIPETIALSFLDLAIYGEIRAEYFPLIKAIFEHEEVPPYGDAVSRPPSEVQPASPAASYTGRYTSDAFGDLEILEEGTGLSMHLGPNQMTFPLTHFTRDVFTYMVPGENGGRASSVVFTLGADGSASQVLIENLNVHGVGTFVREER